MQNRYIISDSYLKVPLSGGRYSININGDLIDEQNVPLSFTEIDGEDFVNLDFGNGEIWIKIAIIVAIVFKSIRLPFSTWSFIDVLYVDGNKKNIHPSNVCWKYPIGGLNNPRISGHAYIPGFSRYCIAKSGEVWSSCVGRYISPYSDQMGYLMFGITPDIGKRTIVGMHRLLALAYLQYSAQVDALDVNHINGQKNDNRLENLEWLTRQQNCEHAYSTLLRDDNIEVSVKNFLTGEVKHFYSLQDCARNMNVTGGAIRARIASKGSKVYPGAFLFKRKDDDSTWFSTEDPYSYLKNMSGFYNISVENISTSETIIYKSILDVCRYFQVTDGVMWFLFNGNKTEAVYRNHILKKIPLHVR